MKSFQPTRDNVLIHNIPMENVTAGGIHITHHAKEVQNRVLRGTVIAVGPGQFSPAATNLVNTPPEQPGETVYYMDREGGWPSVDIDDVGICYIVPNNALIGKEGR